MMAAEQALAIAPRTPIDRNNPESRRAARRNEWSMAGRRFATRSMQRHTAIVLWGRASIKRPVAHQRRHDGNPSAALRLVAQKASVAG
jgi:hypothetical protein